MHASQRQSALFGPNRLRLGIFAANCSGGLAATKVPERWAATWDDNEAIAKMADAAGIEFMLPIARWRGYGEFSDYHRSTFETITWACGLLSATKSLTVFGTVHAPLIHPILAAKQFVTVDHIGRGRFGLNIVCGWNDDEFEMFGEKQREHDTRYEFGQEWLDVVQRIWRSDEPFDFQGRFFKLKGTIGHPKPFGGSEPVLMNAGASAAGRAFGVRNCDFLFTILVDLEKSKRDVAEIKAQAAALGRKALEIFTTSYVVCRPTQKEAEEYHHHYAIEQADWPAVDRLMALQGQHTRGRPPELQQKFRERFSGGHGTYPIIGTPDRVAEELEAISNAGFGGLTVSFVDYRRELPFFIEHVLPRLERKKIRQPVAA